MRARNALNRCALLKPQSLAGIINRVTFTVMLAITLQAHHGV
jgi:hypothetical protein